MSFGTFKISTMRPFQINFGQLTKPRKVKATMNVVITIPEINVSRLTVNSIPADVAVKILNLLGKEIGYEK